MPSNTLNDSQPPSSPDLPSDRAILEAYREWLHFEGRLCAQELWPEMGARAEKCVLRTDIFAFHFPLDRDWREMPQPSSRAELVLRAVGALALLKASNTEEFGQ